MKKLYHLILITFFTFVINSCQSFIPSQQVGEEFDVFDDTKRTYLKSNFLDNSDFTFDLLRTVHKSDTNYNIAVRYLGSENISFKRGKSLILILDNKKLEFNTTGRPIRQLLMESPRIYYETQFYNLNFNQILEIMNSKRIRVRIIGNRIYDTTFTDATLNGIKKFYNKCFH